MDIGGPNFPSRNVKITPINPSLRYRPDPQIGGQNRQGGVATPTPPLHPLPPEKTSNLGGAPPGGGKKGGGGGGAFWVATPQGGEGGWGNAAMVRKLPNRTNQERQQIINIKFLKYN